MRRYLLALFASTALLMGGCADDDPIEEAGDAIEDAGDEIEDGLDD